MAPWSNTQAIVLAAGPSTRFKTDQPKLVFPICGQEMILFPTKMLHRLGLPLTLVVGHKKELIQAAVKQAGLEPTYAEQLEPKGTGHALLCSRPFWHADHILVMNGDVPLLVEEIIEDLINKHVTNQAVLTFVTAHNSDPELTGYGRVVRDGSILRVIEQFDSQHNPAQQCCVNGGVYIIKRSFLEASIHRIMPYPHSGETGIPELIRIASSQGLRVETSQVPFDYVRGVNTLKDLWLVEHIKRSELIAYWMTQGVRFAAAQNVHIDLDIIIGHDSFIGLGVLLLKGSRIGSHCRVDAFSLVSNSIIHDHATILAHSAIYDSVIHEHAKIGPFAHIRKESNIGPDTTIGNFVEVSESTTGSSTKAKHLAYLGNAQIGSQVHIGAGTVTCNYDGFSKQVTTIHDGAFIGNNTALVAPLSIGKEAITAPGSTLTSSVPDYAFTTAHATQITKEDYAPRLRQRLKEQAESRLTLPLKGPFSTADLV
jgi:bifunctional UDP-N-acetylglucosamine pyrophosphorylase / glucosamine-1-phosphate N-acetyltransferase